MRDRSAKTYVRRIYKGYARLLKAAAVLLAGGVSILVLSLVIVAPLWFLATRFTVLYSLACLVVLAAALAIYMARRISSQSRKQLMRRLARTSVAFAALALIYLTVVLYSARIYAAAVPLSILLAAGIGLLLHGRKHTTI